jgi:hypothetical protein
VFAEWLAKRRTFVMRTALAIAPGAFLFLKSLDFVFWGVRDANVRDLNDQEFSGRYSRRENFVGLNGAGLLGR